MKTFLILCVPFIAGCVTLDMPTRYGNVSISTDGHEVLFGIHPKSQP